MIHGPPMLVKVEIHFIKQAQELQWARKELQMMFKIAILMGVRASWAWKENLFFSFIVNDWDKSMIYLQGYREKATGNVMGMEEGLQVQAL